MGHSEHGQRNKGHKQQGRHASKSTRNKHVKASATGDGLMGGPMGGNRKSIKVRSVAGRRSHVAAAASPDCFLNVHRYTKCRLAGPQLFPAVQGIWPPSLNGFLVVHLYPTATAAALLVALEATRSLTVCS